MLGTAEQAGWWHPASPCRALPSPPGAGCSCWSTPRLVARGEGNGCCPKHPLGSFLGLSAGTSRFPHCLSPLPAVSDHFGLGCRLLARSSPARSRGAEPWHGPAPAGRWVTSCTQPRSRGPAPPPSRLRSAALPQPGLSFRFVYFLGVFFLFFWLFLRGLSKYRTKILLQ